MSAKRNESIYHETAETAPSGDTLAAIEACQAAAASYPAVTELPVHWPDMQPVRKPARPRQPKPPVELETGKMTDLVRELAQTVQGAADQYRLVQYQREGAAAFRALVEAVDNWQAWVAEERKYQAELQAINSKYERRHAALAALHARAVRAANTRQERRDYTRRYGKPGTKS